MSNIKSVYNALKYLGAEPVIADAAWKAWGDKLVIPGVGAFGNGMNKIEPFIPRIMEFMASNLPVLGICLGLQMFFDGSEESPSVKGLELIRGKVMKIRSELKLPHIGWNSLEIRKKACPLFKGIDGGFAYFVHSYHALPEEDVVAATTDYGCEINASVWRDNVFGVQFHPEKSGILGLKILKNFLET